MYSETSDAGLGVIEDIRDDEAADPDACHVARRGSEWRSIDEIVDEIVEKIARRLP
jgi:hypothetical protein